MVELQTIYELGLSSWYYYDEAAGSHSDQWMV